MNQREEKHRASPAPLGRGYAGLSGALLLERLADDGREDILEAMWRYGDPGLCAAVVDPVLRTGCPAVLPLFVEQVLAPSVQEPFPARLIEGLRQRRPQLSADLTRALAERLVDPAPLSHTAFEQGRDVLEMWVLGQRDEHAARFALRVVKGETPRASQESVRQAAHSRCASDAETLAQAASALKEQLESVPSGDLWARVAQFVETACRERRDAVDAIHPLARRLVALAAELAPVEQFGPELCRLLGGPLFEDLRSMLSEPLPDRPGARALLRAIGAARHSNRRAQLFARAMAKQPHLFSTLQPLVQAWSQDEWGRGLRALATADRLAPNVASWVVSSAPEVLTAPIITFAINQAADLSDPILATAGSRLSQRLQTLDAQGEQRGDVTATVDWRRLGQPDTIDKLRAVLGALDPLRATALVVGAFEATLTSAQQAAKLVPQSQGYEALRALTRPDVRAELALALCRERPDVALAAASRLQQEEFAIEVAAALGPQFPDAAFAGGAEAWPTIEARAKDRLVGLLENYGTKSQMPLLEVVIRDDHRANADRRAKALSRATELLSEGEPVPGWLTDLLSSNIARLREGAVRAIEKLKPRDPELIRRLHEVRKRGGDPGRAAEQALDALADGFLRELADVPAKDSVKELLPPLGATGRPQVLETILRYLGSEGVYDDPSVHRMAAKAVREVAEHVSEVHEADQRMLVDLVDGELREADPEARDDLAKALARLQLGEDEALASLFDMAAMDIPAHPGALFGAEKDPLVRQLALYRRESARGEVGRGAALTHLDNVGERLVRAAYLVCAGGSDSIKAQIRSDPRKPDYGELIQALASVKELQRIRNDCGKLHELRSSSTEVPHPGAPPDDEVWATAHHCFKQVATRCLQILGQAAAGKR
jgi:hypothetical protein